MKFDIRRKATAAKSFRVAAVMGQFDLASESVEEHFEGEIDIDGDDWSVGVIYGASGTGKSTIAKELWPSDFIHGYAYTAATVIDDMPKDRTVTEITKMFNSVGFSTVWSWLKPYQVLSTGEKMRVDLARAVLEDRELVVFDEFTSVVNREVAKIGSFALAKTVRRMGKKFIAVTCHNDVIPWLQPDWTFCTDTMTFEKKNPKTIHRPRNMGMRPILLESFSALSLSEPSDAPWCQVFHGHIQQGTSGIPGGVADAAPKGQESSAESPYRCFA